MAKNVSLLGANYPAVPAVQLPQTGGGTATFIDGDDIVEKLAVITNLVSEALTFPATFGYLGKSFTLTQNAIVRFDAEYNNSRPVAIGIKTGTGQYNQIIGFNYIDTNVVPSSATGLTTTTMLAAGTYYLWGQANIDGAKNRCIVNAMYFKQ